MFMKRFTRPFRQLRGKLTLSYTLTSVASFLLVELIFITVVLVVVSLNLPAIVLRGLLFAGKGSKKQEAPQAAPYFVHGSPDRKELTSWLSVVNAALPNLGPPGQSHPIFLAVVNMQGQTLASISSHLVSAGTPLQAQLSPQSRANLQAVLHDGKGTISKISMLDRTQAAVFAWQQGLVARRDP